LRWQSSTDQTFDLGVLALVVVAVEVRAAHGLDFRHQPIARLRADSCRPRNRCGCPSSKQTGTRIRVPLDVWASTFTDSSDMQSEAEGDLAVMLVNSTPIERRPSRWAAKSVVPLPANGSRITPPSGSKAA
jgi:hypothetical protein